VRNLADQSGGMTDSYSYNAYGIRLVKSGDTENMYYYCGEQMDEATGLYYLRARYMNPLTATFTQRDSYEGELESPLTQNRYLYAGGNPVMYSDPGGNNFSFGEALTTLSVMDVLCGSMFMIGGYAAAQAGTLMLKAMVSTIEFNGLGNQFVHWFTKITEQETYIPIFVADEAVKRIIIDLIPESKPFFEVMPEYDGERQTVILDPGLVQKAFWEIIQWAEGESNAYYKEGLENVPNEWNEIEVLEDKVKSESFKEFLRNQGKSTKGWKKVMEKWASPDGKIYQRHYWTNGVDFYYHEGIIEFFPH